MWGEILFQTTEVGKAALLQLGKMLVKFIGLLVIIFIGWIFAKAIKSLIVKILDTVKLDKLAESTGINSFLAKGSIKQTLSELIGVLVYWLCILVTVAVVVNFLNLVIVGELLNNIIQYVPRIIVSVFIGVLGIFLSTLLKSMVEVAAANAGLTKAKLLAKIAETVVIAFTILIALEQLITSETISLLVKAIIISVASAIALAFGLGCKDMAAKALTDWLGKLQEKK